MKIIITTIPHDKQRYPTVGDWQWDDEGNLKITVSQMDDWRMVFLVAFHEQMEAMLCLNRGIKEQDITDFDMEYEATRLEDDTSEPGDHPLAPYRREHFFATTLERLMCAELEVEWDIYEKVINDL